MSTETPNPEMTDNQGPDQFATATHTAGPWRFTPTAERTGYHIVSEETLVCTCAYSWQDSNVTRDMNDANGQLLAAAPEMHAALTNARRFIMDLDLWRRGGLQREAVLGDIDRALSKARGEAT